MTQDYESGGGDGGGQERVGRKGRGLSIKQQQQQLPYASAIKTQKPHFTALENFGTKHLVQLKPWQASSVEQGRLR